MLNKEKYKAFKSNAGLAYEEYSYFVEISDNKFICVGTRTFRNEGYSLGTIVTTTEDYREVDYDKVIPKNELEPTTDFELTLREELVDFIIEQEKKIKELEKQLES